MKLLINLFAIAILFSSCEKVVELDLSNNENKLVIEGNVTDQPGPYFVKLTKSVNFNEPNIYTGIDNAFVVISDDAGQRDTLTYSSNGIYQTRILQGVPGRTYFLSVTEGAKNYTAQSKMPTKVPLDSLKLNTFPFNGDNQTNVIPIYNDPLTIGNNYFFQQTVNNRLDKTLYPYNDNLNNGETSQRPLFSNDPDLKLKSGDVVKIEMRCIDLTVYTYYFSLSEQTGGGFGGGTTPSNPPNNIQGNALGIFSAYTTQNRTVIVP